MFTFPCPWCDLELLVTDRAEVSSQVRCEGCATVVDLAPRSLDEPADALPLAA